MAVARAFAEQGAEHLHLVDLDGAREGRVANRDVIARVVQAVSLICQVGGGLRDEESMRAMLDLGVERLVMGTQALRQPEWFSTMCRRYPGRLVLGIDARGGQVATEGWLHTSQTAAVDLALQFAEEPLAAIVYTDIANDGMLAGPNLDEIATMARSVDLPLLASGGVSCLEDLQALANVPVAGAIVGRALYEQRIELGEALKIQRITRNVH